MLWIYLGLIHHNTFIKIMLDEILSNRFMCLDCILNVLFRKPIYMYVFIYLFIYLDGWMGGEIRIKVATAVTALLHIYSHESLMLIK